VRPGDVIIADGVSLLLGRDEQWTLRCLPYYFAAAELDAVLLPVMGIQAAEQLGNKEAQVWAVVFHPDGVLQTHVVRVPVVSFHKVTLLQSNGIGGLPGGILRILGALLALQHTPKGKFDVHLPLARVYALDRQLVMAYRELQAARSLALTSAAARKALRTTAEYLRAQQLQQ